MDLSVLDWLIGADLVKKLKKSFAFGLDSVRGRSYYCYYYANYGKDQEKGYDHATITQP